MTVQRCGWVIETDPLYVAYHDDEWGRPLYDSRALWELLCLEGFQAGLSWITILRKREDFRQAFDGFDPDKVAQYGEAKIEALLANPCIIRSRAKIIATIAAARLYHDIEREPGGFSGFIWSVVNHKPIHNHPASLADVPVSTAQSEALSAKLKKRGFKFCGPVICYAFMQAAGLVIDHVVTCHCHRPSLT